jgi:PAS domain-containing protein
LKQWELRGITAPKVNVTPTWEISNGSTRSLRALVDQFPAIVWTTDTDLRFTTVLGGELDRLGLWPNQIVGSMFFEFFESDHIRALVVAAHLRALHGETVTFDLDLGGSVFHSRLAPLRDSEGTVIGAVGVAVTCEESERMERALHLTPVG